MVWIVAAVPSTDDLPEDAAADFHEVAKNNPAAPWRLETGHLRAGREILEEMTGRSWEEVDLAPDEVKADYEVIKAKSEAFGRRGLGSALVGFLEVCAKHGFGLEGGVGARKMRR
jgi:hypothetical protein